MAAFDLSAYLVQSDRLRTAGKGLLTAVRAPQAKLDRHVDEVVEAAQLNATAGMAMGFAGRAETAPPPGLDDMLASVLFDFQSANMLISAGIATEGPDREAGSNYLAQSVRQIEQAHAEIGASAAFVFGFNANDLVHSEDLKTACSTFALRSHTTLESFLAETQDVVQMIIDQLKKMDVGKALDAINQLGTSFDVVRNVGILVKQGIEKLKGALQALTQLLGEDALKSIKTKLVEIWKHITEGKYTHDALAWTFGIEQTEARIKQILAAPGLQVPTLDAATNALLPLGDSYAKSMKLLKTLLGSVVVVSTALALFHIALPWLPLLTATTYVAILAAAVLIGMNYSESSGILHWVKGVGEIVSGIDVVQAKKSGAN